MVANVGVTDVHWNAATQEELKECVACAFQAATQEELKAIKTPALCAPRSSRRAATQEELKVHELDRGCQQAQYRQQLRKN